MNYPGDRKMPEVFVRIEPQPSELEQGPGQEAGFSSIPLWLYLFPHQLPVHRFAADGHGWGPQDQFVIPEFVVAPLLAPDPVGQQRLGDRMRDHTFAFVDRVTPAISLVTLERRSQFLGRSGLAIGNRERLAMFLPKLGGHVALGVIHQQALRVSTVGRLAG